MNIFSELIVMLVMLFAWALPFLAIGFFILCIISMLRR